MTTSAPGSNAQPASDSAVMVTFLISDERCRAAETRPASNPDGHRRG